MSTSPFPVVPAGHGAGGTAGVVAAVGAWPRDAAVVRRAAEEARCRGDELALLHVLDEGPARGTPETPLGPAAALAHRHAPDVTTRTALRSGSVVAALLRTARSARLLVLGSEGAPPRAKLVRGAVTVNVASRAPAEVEVVPVPGDAEGAPRTRVVAVATREDQVVALADTAFAEAERVGARLDVWCAYDDAPRETVRRRALAALAGWLRSRPDVPCDVAVARPRTTGAVLEPLLTSLEPTDLVVVAQGHGATAWGRPDGTSRTLVERSRCPVLVVPAARPQPGGGPALSG